MSKSESLLFKLIKSLDKNEKGYFKKQARQYASKQAQNYLLLFDAMDKQKEHDENALKDKLGSNLSASGYSQVKSYLLDAILRSLTDYYDGHLVSDTINNLVASAKVLFKKSMELDGAKYLTKAKALAHKVEDLQAILTIIKLEKHVLVLYYDEDFDARRDILLDEEQEVIEKLLTINAVQKVNLQLFSRLKKYRYLRGEDDKKKAQQLIDADIMKGEDWKNTTQAKLLYYGAHLYYHDLVKENLKAMEYAQHMLDAWHAHPEFLHEHMFRYLSIFQNFMNECWQNRLFEEIPPKLEMLRQLKPKSLELRSRIFEVHSLGDIMYHMSPNNMRSYLPRIDTFLEELNAVKETIRPNLRWQYIYNISVFCLFTGNFDRALELLNLLEIEENYDQVHGQKSGVLILNLMIHYNLGNTDLLPHLIRNTERAFKKHEIDELGFTFLKFMRHLINAPLNERKQIMEGYLQETIELEAANEGKPSIAQLIDWKLWLRSHLEDVAMVDLMEEMGLG